MEEGLRKSVSFRNCCMFVLPMLMPFIIAKPASPTMAFMEMLRTRPVQPALPGTFSDEFMIALSGWTVPARNASVTRTDGIQLHLCESVPDSESDRVPLRESEGKVDKEHAWPRGRNVPGL